MKDKLKENLCKRDRKRKKRERKEMCVCVCRIER